MPTERQAIGHSPADANDIQIGRIINFERRAQRFSATHLAEIAGLSTTTLQLVEAGCGRLKASELVAVLRALGRSPSWLFLFL